MPNNLGLVGAQSQKPTRFAPLYTGRFSSGIWTNRSPLRDATTNRITEKFYGPAGDALIAGLNTEITNKLSLARRPGTTPLDGNTYTAPDRFYEFRLFNSTTEQINVMIDQANALYSWYNGVKSLVFTKSTGAGESYMQSVGNTLYFADGVDNKKWLQSLVVWAAGTTWNQAATPFFTTFLIDPNGNIQQLTGTNIPVTNINVTSDVLTVTSSETLTDILSVGVIVTFPASMTATFLENQSVTITAVTTNTFTAALTNDDYTGTETITAVAVNGGTPISGSTEPTWSTQVPSSADNFQGGITVDGSVQWTNRGPTIENWGIQAPTTAVTPIIGKSYGSTWQKNTFYSFAGVIIDTNGNLQQVTTAGTSAGTVPTWGTTLYGTTTSGSAVFTMIQNAASLTWQSGYAYVPPFTITQAATASGGSTVYTGLIPTGASNALAGLSFLITGFGDTANNGIFACTASTTTTLTLSNSAGVIQDATIEGLAVQQETVQYIIGNTTGGANCLFKLTPANQISLVGNVSSYIFNASTTSPGSFQLFYPTSLGSAVENNFDQNSLQFLGQGGLDGVYWNIINGAGATTGTNLVYGDHSDVYNMVLEATLNVPVAGNYAFSFTHEDGAFWGAGGGATLVSGPAPSLNTYGQTQTAVNGYTSFGGNNNFLAVNTDMYVVNFPSAGSYPIEINYKADHSDQQFNFTCNGNVIASGTVISGATQPTWPGFTTSFAPNYATVSEASGRLLWSNVGLTTDFVFTINVGYTLPNTLIVDTNGFLESPYRSGVSGATQPTWNTSNYGLTADQPNLIWLNLAGAASFPSGSLSTFNGGWIYWIALVNTLDNTVSNCTPASVATGNFSGAAGVDIPPGDGLPALSLIDPQADYVAIFRSTDGETTPFLIPGASTTYTLTLADYIENGYTDTTPDTGLNNLISGAILGQNTPPAPGAKNLAYLLNRIFYSVGNVAYWTSGPSTPVGNGLNGTAPLDYDAMPSLVTRIVPTSAGAMVFTVSDVYLIQGNGTSSSPILSAVPILPGIGLLSYNALDMNGPLIGLFTTDSQFLILDPSAGTIQAGFPIADQFRLDNGNPGQSWNPANVYVAWHVQGEDQAWYVCDGANGWYRLMPTPSPETGYTWCPFAEITGGAGAVQSVEITPGVHRLLIGPTGTGSILERDLTVWSDNGTAYPANAVIGSIVLAQPGQVATVSFITIEGVRVGTPTILGILVDEAYPYYTGPVDILKYWVNDPPTFKPSRSLYRQRFYLSELREDSAAMRHCQVNVIFPSTDNVQNEVFTITVFGAYLQEL